MSKPDRENWMPAAMRKSVIRETFETITAVECKKWKAGELEAWGYEPSEDDRQHFAEQFSQRHFAAFEEEVADPPDNRLLDMRDEWIEKADQAGMTAWRKEMQRDSFEALCGECPTYRRVASSPCGSGQ